MMKKIEITEILDFLDEQKEDYCFAGNRNSSICGFSSLTQYVDGSITWIKNETYLKKMDPKTKICLAVVQNGIGGISGEAVITAKESKRVFFDIIEHFYGTEEKCAPIGEGTFLSPGVKLGKNVIIGHNCTLDGDIIIDDNTRIYNNVVIVNRVKIGKNCVIQSGVTIGHDGFGYTDDPIHGKKMIKHYGGVTIGDEVLIGTNVSMARGTIDDTSIGDGCKIDNLCHIAHNAVIGKSVGIVAGSLIYGSAHIGDNVYIASAIVRNQLFVGNNSFLGMGSVVTKDVESNTVVTGIPAKKLRDNI